MAARVDVVDRFAADSGDRALAQRAAQAARAFAGREALSIALLLTDDAEIAQLHGVHLDDPTPTDVMSFASDDGVDVVVSVECAERHARAHGTARAAELALYVVHGVLHACGFDDTTAPERARMRAAEREVLASLGLHVARVD